LIINKLNLIYGHVCVCGDVAYPLPTDIRSTFGRIKYLKNSGFEPLFIMVEYVRELSIDAGDEQTSTYWHLACPLGGRHASGPVPLWGYQETL
jgi:hypothetical protein